MSSRNYLWIDLALYAQPEKEHAGLDWLRLERRVRKETPVQDLSAQDQALLRKFSQAVGLWALIEEDRIAEYLPAATVRHLVDLAPDTIGDPAHHAALFIQQYLHEADARPGVTAVSGRLHFGTTAHGIHAFTTHPWQEWIRDPSHAVECEQCGRVFTPSRSDARYCGAACRVAAAKERRESAA